MKNLRSEPKTRREVRTSVDFTLEVARFLTGVRASNVVVTQRQEASQQASQTTNPVGNKASLNMLGNSTRANDAGCLGLAAFNTTATATSLRTGRHACVFKSKSQLVNSKFPPLIAAFLGHKTWFRQGLTVVPLITNEQ